VWGPRYLDQIVQIAINQAPSDDPEFDPEDEDHDAAYYWPTQDANWNVTALFGSDGGLVERYAYTPYGERTAYTPLDGNDTYGTLETGETQAVLVDSVAQPYGLCNLGHQGLFLDKEWKAYDNRNRVFMTTLGRFLQRDPKGYDRLLSFYPYLLDSPVNGRDPYGLEGNIDFPMPQGWPRNVTEARAGQIEGQMREAQVIKAQVVEQAVYNSLKCTLGLARFQWYRDHEVVYGAKKAANEFAAQINESISQGTSGIYDTDAIGILSGLAAMAHRKFAEDYESLVVDARAGQERACRDLIIPYCCPDEAKRHCEKYMK